VARSSIRLGSRAIDPPRDLGAPGAFNGLASLIPRDQGIDEAGVVGANIFERASDQGGRSTIIPCSPVAGTACMAMVAGNQGPNMTSRPGRLLRIGPNIAGSLEPRVTRDMLPDDPTCSLVAACPMTTWCIGTKGRLEA
jgi:hypothetical protein